jgi:hypothetical protein
VAGGHVLHDFTALNLDEGHPVHDIVDIPAVNDALRAVAILFHVSETGDNAPQFQVFHKQVLSVFQVIQLVFHFPRQDIKTVHEGTEGNPDGPFYPAKNIIPVFHLSLLSILLRIYFRTRAETGLHDKYREIPGKFQ